jgi:hypothetical protein
MLQSGAGRVIAGVFGFAFAGIGLTVLVFLWGAPWDEFGSPPLFFRLVGSFIAVVFVVVGGMSALGAITGGGLKPRINFPGTGGPPERQSGGPANPSGYVCPHCGAPLGKGAEVSPSGDVKCTYCSTWFNIHRAALAAGGGSSDEIT